MSTKQWVFIGVFSILVGGAMFYLGMTYQKSMQPMNGVNGQRQGAGTRQFGQGGSLHSGANNGGGFATGEILAKDDESLTIKMRDGSSKIVFFSDSTIVGRQAPGTSADFTIGAQVMVTGKANADGSLSADNINLRPVQP